MIQILFYLLLPLAGILGYWFEISWLYYAASILNLVFVLFAIGSKNLSKGNFEMLLVCMIGCWVVSHSFISGVLLGACLHLIVNGALSVWIILKRH